MKLYVSMAGVEYEGENIIGIFDTEEKATNSCIRHYNEHKDYCCDYYWVYDSYVLNEVIA